MHCIEEKFKTIIVSNVMRHTVSPDTFLLIIFNSFFRYSFSKGICHLSCTCTDGQLLEGEQIPLCPKFSKFIGREENF